MSAAREIATVAEATVLGPDSQVEQKALVLEPGRWADHDPFLLMAEDWFSEPGFDFHPHRGIETVTYVLEGGVEHRDNHGGVGRLGPGDVQWMTAGRGIIHSELAVDRQPVHTLQLWLNLPAASKMIEPRYQDLRAEDMPVREEPGARLRVYSGSSGGVTSPTLNHVPVTMVELMLEPGATVHQNLPESYRGFLYVLEGSGRFGTAPTFGRAGQVLRLGATGTDLEIGAADEPLRVLLFAGEPLHEPVIARGPFVMNTPEQIAEAYADYRAGAFGPIPAAS